MFKDKWKSNSQFPLYLHILHRQKFNCKVQVECLIKPYFHFLCQTKYKDLGSRCTVLIRTLSLQFFQKTIWEVFPYNNLSILKFILLSNQAFQYVCFPRELTNYSLHYCKVIFIWQQINQFSLVEVCIYQARF